MTARDWKKTVSVLTSACDFQMVHKVKACFVLNSNHLECDGQSSATNTYVITVNVSVWQHHRRIVLIQRLTTDVADQSRLGAVRVGKVASQLIEMRAAHWAVRIFSAPVFLVALPAAQMKESFRNQVEKYFVGEWLGVARTFERKDTHFVFGPTLARNHILAHP